MAKNTAQVESQELNLQIAFDRLHAAAEKRLHADHDNVVAFAYVRAVLADDNPFLYNQERVVSFKRFAELTGFSRGYANQCAKVGENAAVMAKFDSLGIARAYVVASRWAQIPVDQRDKAIDTAINASSLSKATALIKALVPTPAPTKETPLVEQDIETLNIRLTNLVARKATVEDMLAQIVADIAATRQAMVSKIDPTAVAVNTETVTVS